jgi:hypothetical protein
VSRNPQPPFESELKSSNAAPKPESNDTTFNQIGYRRGYSVARAVDTTYPYGFMTTQLRNLKAHLQKHLARVLVVVAGLTIH